MIRTAAQLALDIAAAGGDIDDPGTLTVEQRVLLGMVADGHTHAAIARRTGLAASLVQSRLSAIYRRLGARNAPHAVAIAIRAGLLPAPEQEAQQ